MLWRTRGKDMKKIALLFTLTLCASALNGMEVPKPNPQKQDYMAMLPTEIKKEIVLALVQSSTVEEAVNAIRSLTETNKEFNKIINDPITTRTIIRLLVQKFNAPSGYIAQQLGTPGSKYYLQLSSQLPYLLWKQDFDSAEKLLHAGADMDFQPVDTYPMFCTTSGTINLLGAIDGIIYMKTVIIDTEKSLLFAQEQSPLDEENIKTHQQIIKSYQDALQETISNLQNLTQNNKNIFKNDEEFNYFISIIEKENFQEAFALIKPKEVISYNQGITAYYAIGETDVCAIGANFSLVIYTIAANQPALLEWLFKHKANLDLFMGTGTTALLMAIDLGKKDIIELLVKNGANINQKNIAKAKKEEIREDAPFLISVDKQRAKMPYALLDNDTLTSIFEIGLAISEETPLINLLLSDQFTDEEQYDLVKLLLDNGANPNMQDAYGNTPLTFALSMESNFMKLLLDHGADPSIKDNDGLTVLERMTQPEENDEEDEEDEEREEKIEILKNAIKKQPTIAK